MRGSMAGGTAPRVSHGEVDNSTVFTIANGSPVSVYGITFTNSGATSSLSITARRVDTGATILNMFLRPPTSHHVHIPFYADGGIEFIGNGDDLDVTVYHSSPGAQSTREFATKITHLTFPIKDEVKQIDSGNPINVYGMVIASSSTTINGFQVDMRTADGDETILLKTKPDAANSQRSNAMISNIPFCADKGLEFLAPDAVDADNVHVTVFHSSTGI